MKRRFSWLAAVQWTLLTALGMLMAGGFHFPGGYGSLRWNPAEFGLGSGILGFIFGAVSGLFIAGAQAIVLQAWGVPVRRWLLLNAVGYGLVHAVADALPYRPFTIYGGGIVMAACQYLALRGCLSRPLWWLPLAAGSWWLGFGLTAGRQDYNIFVLAPFLGLASGLGLRLLLVPAAPPGPSRWWARLNRPQRTLLVIALAAVGTVFVVLYAGLSGLIGLF